MSFDLVEMRRLAGAHGRVARIVVASTAGSVPREVGAAMVVWSDGQHGTIGGGALELTATQAARQLTRGGTSGLQRRQDLVFQVAAQ